MRIVRLPGGLVFLLLLSFALLTLTLGCVAKQPPTPAIPTGQERVDLGRVDELLRLSERPDVDLLLLDTADPEAVSTVHVDRVRDWIEEGGVLWAVGDGLESGLTRQLVPLAKRDMDFHKATTGQEGGELIVRGESPNLEILDHPLTTGVERLYLFPVWRFDGTEGAEPLVRMVDTEGALGTVMAAVPIGRGYVVLDGTARGKSLIRNRIPGFDADHPNAHNLEGQWKSYDWDRLMQNAREHGGRDVPADTGGGT